MNKNKFSIGWYMFALFGGLASGLTFSKAQYHKGQADAYNKIAKDLEKVSEEIEEYFEEYLEEHKEEESQQ